MYHIYSCTLYNTEVSSFMLLLFRPIGLVGISKIFNHTPSTQCARRHELCGEAVPYHELSAQVRLKLFRVSCIWNLHCVNHSIQL